VLEEIGYASGEVVVRDSGDRGRYRYLITLVWVYSRYSISKYIVMRDFGALALAALVWVCYSWNYHEPADAVPTS
jgi:hypothetical protein